jgi:hypothetical protein
VDEGGRPATDLRSQGVDPSPHFTRTDADDIVRVDVGETGTRTEVLGPPPSQELFVGTPVV